MFAILQKYDFSSKSQRHTLKLNSLKSCLRYCKSTIFQANHNKSCNILHIVRLFAILQKYDFSSKSQLCDTKIRISCVVCDTAKVRFFKQITTSIRFLWWKVCCLRYCKSTIFQANHNYMSYMFLLQKLFAILQKYDFSSKSQHRNNTYETLDVVCDTAKVRFFKQITTFDCSVSWPVRLFAILQKYDFSSKSQLLIIMARN